MPLSHAGVMGAAGKCALIVVWDWATGCRPSPPQIAATHTATRNRCAIGATIWVLRRSFQLCRRLIGNEIAAAADLREVFCAADERDEIERAVDRPAQDSFTPHHAAD